VMTAWAQQPAQPTAEALRDRVQQYYQLMVDKKYRQAEAMVADDSKEDYYAGKKPDLKSFDIMNIDLQTANTAKVTIRAKVLLLMPGAGAQLFDMPTPTYWKLENGAWCWYIPEEIKNATPFGKVQTNQNAGTGLDMKGAAPGGIETPDIGALVGKISIDRLSVTLSAGKPEGVVTITNSLPGPIEVALDSHVNTISGIKVDVQPLHVEGGATAKVRIRRTGNVRKVDTVAVVAEPFHRVFSIEVRVE
jgi:hypothetical protein